MITDCENQAEVANRAPTNLNFFAKVATDFIKYMF